ncbi:hypothetical protein GCM10020216_102000 [Nonomuraea helvata]
MSQVRVPVRPLRSIPETFRTDLDQVVIPQIEPQVTAFVEKALKPTTRGRCGWGGGRQADAINLAVERGRGGCGVGADGPAFMKAKRASKTETQGLPVLFRCARP